MTYNKLIVVYAIVYTIIFFISLPYH